MWMRTTTKKNLLRLLPGCFCWLFCVWAVTTVTMMMSAASMVLVRQKHHHRNNFLNDVPKLLCTGQGFKTISSSPIEATTAPMSMVVNRQRSTTNFFAVTAFSPPSSIQPTQRQLVQRRRNHQVVAFGRSSTLVNRRYSSSTRFDSFPPTGLFMTAMEDPDQDQDQKIETETTSSTTTTTTTTTSMEEEKEDRKWNLGGLRKEVSRLTVRCHKKIGKANQRIQNAKLEVERLLSKDDATDEELDSCPNIDQLEQDRVVIQTRLQQLNQLEVLLQDIKGKNGVVLPDHISSLAISLDVNDTPLTSNPQSSKNNNKQKKKTTKEKGPKNMTPFRRPYRRYYTLNKTEIRVGKQAEDNDELSLNADHRDSLDWWMHASGCPGSHVVIRCHDQSLPKDVVEDAAALAARQSKCNGSTIKVSLTRARDIKKPPGAKAGLVQLTGDVKTVSVNMKEAQARLDRLDKTVLVN